MTHRPTPIEFDAEKFAKLSTADKLKALSAFLKQLRPESEIPSAITLNEARVALRSTMLTAHGNRNTAVELHRQAATARANAEENKEKSDALRVIIDLRRATSLK